MAAISIISGTSLNAFFHPCENLQSTAIQHTWRGASSQLLSCIAKTELCYQRAEKVRPGQCPLLPLGWAEMAQRVATGREAHCCDGWGDKLCSSPLASHWHPLHSRSDSSGQEDLQGFGKAAQLAKNLLLSQLPYGWIPSAARWRVRKSDQSSWYFGHLWFHNIR